MWCLVLMLIFLSVSDGCPDTDYVSEIEFFIQGNDSDNLSCPSDKIKLTVDKKFRLSVKIPKVLSLNDLTEVKCLDKGSSISFANFTFTEDANYKYAKSQCKDVDQNWGKKWSCMLEPILVVCDVTVEMRDREFAPVVYSNGVLLSATNSKATDGFDSEVSYDFYEGETVNFTSHKRNPLTILKITSNVYGGVLMNSIFGRAEVFLYVKLTAAVNGAYIDCHGNDYNAKVSFVTRIYLRLNNSKRPGRPGPPAMECELSDRDQQGYTRLCVNGTAVGGFADEKIYGLYYRNPNTFIVLYRHMDLETLELTCDASQAHWKYNTSILEKSDGTYPDTLNTKSGKFKFIANETRADIACVSEDESTKACTTEITLIRLKETVPGVTTTSEGSVQITDGEAILTPRPDIPDSGGNGLFKNIGLMATIVACTLVFVIAIVFIIVQLCKRKPIPRNADSNINYKNLPEHSKGAMPVPSQWQEDQYAAPPDVIANSDYAVPYNPSLEEMYAIPVPKNERPADNSNETYAQAVPKHLRKGIPVLPVDSMYAELELKPAVPKKPNMKKKAKDLEESPYAEVKRDNPYVNANSYDEEQNESPYAEVGARSYADPSNSSNKGYVNVFKDSRYVNATGAGDYAEPAYCELNKLQ